MQPKSSAIYALTGPGTVFLYNTFLAFTIHLCLSGFHLSCYY